MGRPDMGRHINCRRAQFQHDFQKIVTVQPQNRPSVRVYIPDLLQFRRDPLRILQPREKYDAVNLADTSAFFVDRADLPRNYKTGSNPWVCAAPGNCSLLNPVFLLEHVKTFLRRLQLLRQFFPPGGMCKVSRPHDVNSFSARPQIKEFRRAVLACRTGITGVNM